MKRSITIFIVLTGVAMASLFAAPGDARATSFSVKLPYAKGESFVLVQGYNTLPTHIKKDSYALDLSQDGCAAYGKSAVAVVAGKVMLVSQEGYNGGYGTELIIDHGGNIVSRYAHMIPGSITVASNDSIRQGEIIGRIGDTGLVAGAACETHPGTHLHFAMDTVNGDGTFAAYDPEPISGYTNMTVGRWYLSDNAEDDAGGTAMIGAVLGAYDAVTTSAVGAAVATTTPVFSPAPGVATTTTLSTTTTKNIIPLGGVSVTLPSPTPAPAPDSSVASDSVLAAPSSTMVIGTTTMTTTPSAVPSDVLFEQLDQSISSQPSWYGDNWFDLGNGWSGTLNALTLVGRVNGPRYVPSHIALQEFKDPNYTAMIQQFAIDDSALLTSLMATTTFNGFSILLKPYFYYRLTTLQDLQNVSVILAGTASTTAGVAMWDNFIYGEGGVQSTSTFFPFMVMEGVAATSTLTPPPLTSPGNFFLIFNETEMQLNLSFSTSTDPDWPANPLHYQMNYSTSSSLSDNGWTSPSTISVVSGDSYLIGIRALDNYGAVSAVVTTTWSAP